MSRRRWLEIYVSMGPKRAWGYPSIVRLLPHPPGLAHPIRWDSIESIPLPDTVRDRMHQLHLMLGSVNDAVVDSYDLYSGGVIPPETWCELRRWPVDTYYDGQRYAGDLDYFFALTEAEYDELVATLREADE